MNSFSKHPVIVFMAPLVIVIGIWFYWYQVRPANIEAACYTSTLQQMKASTAQIGVVKGGVEGLDYFYESCWRKVR